MKKKKIEFELNKILADLNVKDIDELSQDQRDALAELLNKQFYKLAKLAVDLGLGVRGIVKDDAIWVPTDSD